MPSFDELWSGLKDNLQSGLDQIQQVGVPVVQASVEQWGISVLQEQNKQTQSQVTAAVKSLSTNPSSPLGAAVASTVQKSVLELYGPHIFLVAVALIGLGFALKAKG